MTESTRAAATQPVAVFRMLDLLCKKRDGEEFTEAEIDYFVQAYTQGDIPDYQASAWLMASLLQGMTPRETAALTDAMLHSGAVLDLSALPAAKVDKHSTGGVGDKTSLVLAPLVAAGGLYVPMISGRGLGHTGGTLDKLEAIPGFRVNLPLPEFRSVLAACGCAMIGATEEIAPADRKLYALRDATATIESRSLICASIMSKKLAEGLDALVLDVKSGSGAFMPTDADAELLAELLVSTGARMGVKTVALITDMNQPLGLAIGNALEVAEVLEVLRGAGPVDLRELCLELAGWMFSAGGRTTGPKEGKSLALSLLDSGKALETFRHMVTLQGGDVRVADDPGGLPQARYRAEILSPANGWVSSIACRQLGSASVLLGGGRERKEDNIDHAVGIVLAKKLGSQVSSGEPLCLVYYNSESRFEAATELIKTSFAISPEPPRNLPPLVHKVEAIQQ